MLADKEGGQVIDLPWFPKELMPNFKRRHHWSAYRGKVAKYRADCGWVVKQWLQGGWGGGVGPARSALRITSVTFYPPDRRKRDDDGMIGAFKAGRDGVADALGSDDNTFKPAYHFAEPVKNGKVVICIGEAA